LFQLTDGGFIFAGTSYDNQVGGYQVYLVGTDANGDLAWESHEGGPYWELSRSMIRADDGGFLVVGSANQPSGIGYDLYALRLTGAGSDVTAVGPPGASIGLQLSNHPNPFNPGTTISFNMPEPGPVHLHIYDFRGRLVRTLLNGELLGAGSQEKFWNGLDDAGRPLAAGIYLSQIVSRETGETRRMTLLK